MQTGAASMFPDDPGDRSRPPTPSAKGPTTSESPAPKREIPASDAIYKPPSLSLPKGGGALRSIGETFKANPVTGTGGLTIPLPLSPGRAGGTPSIALTYDSGAGQGPFGMGWSAFIPSIARKTDKGLPTFHDSVEGAQSDVFVHSGSEDLVPALVADAAGWKLDAFDDGPWRVQRYRPRVEGPFIRIEKRTDSASGDVHWRSVSRDNVTSLYGRSAQARIADPKQPAHVFRWLLEATFDDRGNLVLYDYKPEDTARVPANHVEEKVRLADPQSFANRYIKRVRYGNVTPFTSRDPTPDEFLAVGWLFEAVFDYGEHDDVVPRVDEARPWGCRSDPFSTFRSTFDIRTYRLCQRVLMFHRFVELGSPAPVPMTRPIGVAPIQAEPCLVRSLDLTYDASPAVTYLTSVVATGYVRNGASYSKASMPPLEFEYSRAEPLPSTRVQSIAVDSLVGAPGGVDGRNYRWVDLDGEGISGILTEQAGALFYKKNLGGGRLAPPQPLPTRPSVANLSSSSQQLMSLDGDGQLDLVLLSPELSGTFKRTTDEQWAPFLPLRKIPNVDFADPNLRFVDIDGDGLADVFITEDEVFVWYRSLGKEGFDSPATVRRFHDEDRGPAVVFADGTQSIFLADMTGDGLSDLVRVRNAEISYWPNLGYGRFGAKVTMGNAPIFDRPERFDPKRIRFGDIDGTGTADIVYIGTNGVSLYMNQAGNRWSEGRLIRNLPIDGLSTVELHDLLGSGTACLVWSSPLPGTTRSAIRYVDLLSSTKPHLLVRSHNNLGAETRTTFATSTKFYLADREAGRPWATRLPFPVHVVERVETYDWISRSRFVTRYAYHHGHYDGVEREFRGFGMVEQYDTEELGALDAAGAFPSSTNVDAASYVPPVLTKTWFHTGFFPPAAHVSRVFALEHYHEPNLTDAQLEAMAIPDTVLPSDLPSSEVREAFRSLKGAVLRQEIYSQDGTEAAGRPYSVSEKNYTIQRLQPLEANRHAVFFTHDREAIDFHYERTLYDVAGRKLADPRVTHAMVLAVDDYGNALQSVAIAYGRRHDDLDAVLVPDDHATQKKTLIRFAENDFTNALLDKDAYRTPLPAETRTYEILRVEPEGHLPDVTNLFRFAEASAKIAQAGDGTHDLPYEDVSAAGAVENHPYRRVIERARTIYRKNDLSQGLPLGIVESLAIPFAGYKLALTPGLLSLYTRKGQNLVPDPKDVLGTQGGYVLSDDAMGGGIFPASDPVGHWWVPTGRVFFSPDRNDAAAQELATARAHFFLPRRFEDPFLNRTTVRYDPHDLLLLEAEDALHNKTTLGVRANDGTVTNGNDYRVLQPARLTDPNGNRSEVAFDALGLVVGTAVMGKSTENLGDSLAGFTADLTQNDLDQFFADPRGPPAARLLQNATSRIVYDVGRFQRSPGMPTPSFGAVIARETHVSDLPAGLGSKLQVSLGYSDGFGREIQRKQQAEPGPTAPGGAVVNPRWVASGWTIFNNKGKPVRKYEPFFDDTHDFKFGAAVGVSAILFYDPVGRVVATVHPNHIWEKVVFHAWRQETWDGNDTVLISDPKADVDVAPFFRRIPDTDHSPTWYAQRASNALGATERDAAVKASAHAATPATAYADALGRTFLTVAFNRLVRGAALVEEQYATRTAFDIEGNQREVRDAVVQQSDARGRIAMRHAYDMLGNRTHQASMEAGERWMLNDVGGKPIRGWNSRLYAFRTAYDALRRPIQSFVQGGDGAPESETFEKEILFGRTIYGEQHPQAGELNMRGRVFTQLDGAGVLMSGGQNGEKEEAYDFKGNPLRGSRRLAKLTPGTKKATIDWTTVDQGVPADATAVLVPTTMENALAPLLESETFGSSGTFDALNRPLATIAPDGSVTRLTYNEANRLQTLCVNLHGAAAQALLVPNIEYDAKGRRTRIECGQMSDGSPIAVTTYTYDPQTFRLASITTKRASPRNGFATKIFKDGTTLQALSYAYDPVGNVTQIADAALLTTFRSNAQVDPVCRYTYDAVYRLINATGRELIAQSAVDVSRSNMTLRDYPFVGGAASPNDLQAVRNYIESYDYDGVGNIEQMSHRATGGGWTRMYTYDETSLLEDGASGTPAKRSNRLSGTTLQAAQPTVEPYGYDAHGNMRMPHLSAMGWDFKDQLHVSQRQVVNSGVGERTYCVYDGSGQRIRKVTERSNGTRKNERIYLGPFETYREYDGSGANQSLERQTLHVADGARRAALVETKTTDAGAAAGTLPETLIRFQVDNHLGSASLGLDGRGAVISYEEYLPYGGSAFQATPSSSVEVGAKRYRYTGKERDEETGLDYYGARYCASWVGRWLSCDPEGLGSEINLYTFASSNPLRFYDPNGRKPKELPWYEQLAIGAGEAFKQVGDRVLSVVNFDPIGTAYGVAKNVSTRYKLYSAGTLGESGPSAAVHALNETLNPLAHAEQAADRAARADRVGDTEGHIRGKVQEVASLIDFAFLVGGVAGTVEAATSASSGPGIVRAPTPPTPGAERPTPAISETPPPGSKVAREHEQAATARVTASPQETPGAPSAEPAPMPVGTAVPAAKEFAAQAQTMSPRPGTAGVLTVGDQIFTGVSGSAHAAPLSPAVQAALDAIPAAERSPFHGLCAEPQCISSALNAGVNPAGGTMTTLRVRAVGNPAHGTLIPACPSCSPLLKRFGISGGE